jgi:hypothetical protein
VSDFLVELGRVSVGGQSPITIDGKEPTDDARFVCENNFLRPLRSLPSVLGTGFLFSARRCLWLGTIPQRSFQLDRDIVLFQEIGKGFVCEFLD